MAPERVPSLVVFDSRFENSVLEGSVEYIEPKDPKYRLRVRWNVERQPEGYRSVGKGVAYIYDTGSEVDIAPISEDATPSCDLPPVYVPMQS